MQLRFFSPASTRGCRKSARHDARHIDLCRIVFLSHPEDKNVSVMEQPPEKCWSESLKVALSCPLTYSHSSLPQHPAAVLVFTPSAGKTRARAHMICKNNCNR